MVMETDDQIVALLAGSRKELETLVNEKDNWDIVKEENGITVSRKTVENSQLYCFKMEGTIDAPAKYVFDLLVDVSKRKLIDPNVVEYSLKKQISPEVQIVYQAQQSLAMMVTARDVSIARLIRKEAEDLYVVAARSVTTDLIPPNDNYVRAEVQVSGWLIQATGPNSCKTTACLQVDAKGWTPGFVINAVGPEGSATTFNNLRNAAIAANNSSPLTLALRLIFDRSFF